MRIEIQIRTREMHEQAEQGLAAHWGYKQGSNPKGENYPWLQDLLEILDHASNPEELLEHTRLAMFQSKVFAFTPKGELIQLQRGSTVVDFAHARQTVVKGKRVSIRVDLGGSGSNQ